MSTKGGFVFEVRDLVRRPGEVRERERDVPAPAGWANAVIGVPEGEEVELEVRFESLHDGILVTAEVETEAEGECVRCLIGLEQDIEVDIQELFAYSHDDAFEYEVQGDLIDLEPAVRDAVVLALPFQPVCQEDCLGLCPQCGVRLLDDPDHRHEDPVDPRWSALAGLAQTAEDVAAGDTDPGRK